MNSNATALQRSRRGAILIEVVATLVIAGVLSLIAIPTYNSFINNSRTQVSYEIAYNFANKTNYTAALEQSAVDGQILTDSIEFNEIGVVVTDDPVYDGTGTTVDDIIGWYILVQDVADGDNSAEAWVCIESGKAEPSLTACTP